MSKSIFVFEWLGASFCRAYGGNRVWRTWLWRTIWIVRRLQSTLVCFFVYCQCFYFWLIFFFKKIKQVVLHINQNEMESVLFLIVTNHSKSKINCTIISQPITHQHHKLLQCLDSTKIKGVQQKHIFYQKFLLHFFAFRSKQRFITGCNLSCCNLTSRRWIDSISGRMSSIKIGSARSIRSVCS